MKKLLLAVGILALLSGMWTMLSASDNGYYTRQTTTDVVRGGVHNQEQLTNGLKQEGVAEFYKQVGIPSTLAGAKEGVVYPNGEVKVNGKVVATGAMTFGRKHDSGNGYVSAGGVKFYKHTINRAFQGMPVKAFVFLNADGSFKSAFAKTCGNPIVAKPVPVPAAVCKSLEATITNRDNYKLTAKASTANGAQIKGYKYVIKNANGATVLDRYVAINHTTRSIEGKLPAGTYTAQVSVDTSLGYKTDANCTTKFTIAPEPVKNIKVCELATKKIVTINEKHFDKTKHSKDLKDCDEPKSEKIQVCELATKEIITIDEKDFDEDKHSRDAADCEEVEVPTPPTPEAPTPVEPTPEPTPEAPVVTELPKTGAANLVAVGLGLGLLTALVGYNGASIRKLLGL